MSRLSETQAAYDRIVQLLDQEIRKRSGDTRDLDRYRRILDVAFYLLGWGQFEYLVRQEAAELIDGKANAQTVERHAWAFLKQSLKGFPIRRQLDMIFHTNHTVRSRLQKDYSVRNEAAHDYKLPPEAKDISAWLQSLEDLIDNF
jgi:hypothetical protein